MDNKELIAKALDRPALTRMGHRQQLELAESLARALEAAEAELTRRDTVIARIHQTVLSGTTPGDAGTIFTDAEKTLDDVWDILNDVPRPAAPVSLEAVKAETKTEWGVSHMEGHERAYELSSDRESAKAELRSLNQGYGWPGENQLVTREVTEWRPVKPEEADRV